MHSIDRAAAFSLLKFITPLLLYLHSRSPSSILIQFIIPKEEKISLKCSVLTFLVNPFTTISMGLFLSGESEKEDEDDNKEHTLSLEHDLGRERGELSNDLPLVILNFVKLMQKFKFIK